MAAFLYWIVAAHAASVLVVPTEIIRLASFLPPLLGLMGGPVSAAGAYTGAVLAMPGLPALWDAGDIAGILRAAARELWVPAAGLLPCLLWHRWRVDRAGSAFLLGTGTLAKLMLVLFFTFVVTSAFRALTATPAELELASVWAREIRVGIPPAALIGLACFASDYSLAVFFDVMGFFLLLGGGYVFYRPGGAGRHISPSRFPAADRRPWRVAMAFYAFFPALFIYLDLVQIYGMDNPGTWLRFMVECVTMTDAVLVMTLYYLLRYRRSIMLEVMFLVALTVFLSMAALGWGSSEAMSRFVASRAEDNLKAMSLICRERLDRTFFCVRQAVNGMKSQALDSIESYERLAGDEAYRRDYCDQMERRFSSIAAETDGSMAYYLRFVPEIDGPSGGFSMGRQHAYWEGALAPFARRNPIDLSLYSPNDTANVGWFYTPIKSRHETWIEPYIDPTVQSWVISYVAPLFLEGHCVGVLGMDVDFAFIVQELRRMSVYDYGFVYITNRNSRVLYHPNQRQGNIFQPNPDFKEIEIYLSDGMWLGVAMPLARVHEERNLVMMHMVAAILLVALLVSLASIALAARAVRPLAGMTEVAKRIASGDLSVKISYDSGNEVGLLAKSIREMAAKLEGYVYRDKLTGLRNAAAYMTKAQELEEQRESGDESLAYAVVIFDANFLKRVNDLYGHDAGNELIRRAAQVICRVFAHSPVYRTGGDEFAAILEGADYEARDELLRRFDEETAQEHFEAGGETLTVSVARGLAVYEPGMEYAAVAKSADVAMYNHKAAIKASSGIDSLR